MNKNNLDLFMGQFTIRETLLLTPFRINIYRCFNRFWFQSSHDTIPGFSKTNGKSSLETEKIDGLVWRFLGFCSRFVGLRWCNRQGIWLTGKHVLGDGAPWATALLSVSYMGMMLRCIHGVGGGMLTFMWSAYGVDATLHTWGGGGMLTFMWSAYSVDATLHTWGGGGMLTFMWNAYSVDATLHTWVGGAC